MCVVVCDDITRGAEGKEVGRRTCLELDRDKTEPYLINYPAKTFQPWRKVKRWLGSVLLLSHSFHSSVKQIQMQHKLFYYFNPNITKLTSKYQYPHFKQNLSDD